MENDSAFQPVSPSFCLAAAVTPATAIQLVGSPLSGSQITAKVFNSGAVFAVVSWASNAALALSQCVVPTPGSPQQVMMIAPGEDGTFTVPPGQYWTAATATSTSNIYIQTGFGI